MRVIRCKVKKKSTAQEITPIKAEAGQNNKRGRKGGCRKGMHEYESKGGALYKQEEGGKGKREGEDTSAAA